ncbi:MAG: BlaI/MecI/CopY family transcriptional regulator [Clostridia bacterium]|nr:BlaI/MecI/CopY family transcriptional regulator [Clostridia bacterium]
MENKLGAMEMRFAELIWQNEPINSGELVKLCETELNWKKSTTYTMLRRLCQRGIFQNEGSIVSAVMTREEFDARETTDFVEEKFNGSLPRFLAAFTARKKLSDAEIDALQKLIDDSRS